MIGPEFKSKSVALGESFVSLNLSETWRSDERFIEGREKIAGHYRGEAYLSPEEVMIRAFKKKRPLLIIGDPDSGKTTLLKYYALTCLDNKQAVLGFSKKEVLPLYFPLRELQFSAGKPKTLQENLAVWAADHYLKTSAQEFLKWLQQRKTLVLLDGLDEISDVEKRKQVCKWIENAATGLEHARFVLTSRPTGYWKLDGLELECEHLRADICDFSPQQQELFLQRWFKSAFLSEIPGDTDAEQNKQKIREASSRVGKIIEFLKKDENRGVRELAAVPMLLQIMAIIWKDRDYLPGSRGALYDISLNYLLEYRDDRRNLRPVLPAEKARIPLCALSLHLQEKLRSDNAEKSEFHDFVQPFLLKMDGQPGAKTFCENLRDRAGLIADYGHGRYISGINLSLNFFAPCSS